MAYRKHVDGRKGEEQALQYLTRQGLLPVARNYRCKAGEIDLIMRNSDTLVFVEVRLRRNGAFGGALASIDHRKQQRLLRAAQHYLQRNRWSGPCRFDVVALDGTGRPEWIPDAFGLDPQGMRN